MAWVATGMTVVSGIAGMAASKKAAKAEAKRRKRLQAQLDSLEANRQAVINPYEGITNLTGVVQDLSSEMSNPYANLSVATRAAEMQIEEADIALANTLDTLMATGSGAGGATALAQAALASKKDVAASIEMQEAENEKLRAQGEQTLQNARLAEKTRIQDVALTQAERVQDKEALGKQFVFTQTEARETAKIDRVATQLDGAQAAMAQHNADATAALTGTLSGVANVMGTVGAANLKTEGGTFFKAGTS
tara:strand:- start:548 stop:1297 length:750 start_codon:yes stop_codon:yes gene_type:complete